MFPNDDICNVKAAKNAAKRIFSKYSDPSKQSALDELDQESVADLMKSAYETLNIQYTPNQEDIQSFMSIFQVTGQGKIKYNSMENFAVKYLCGQEGQKEERKICKQEQKNCNFDNYSRKVQHQIPKILTESNYKLKQQQHHVNKNQKFAQKTVLQNFEEQIRGNFLQKEKFNKAMLFQRAYCLFQNNKNRQLQGISELQAKRIIKETYVLFGRKNYNPTENDVRIWMKLCEKNPGEKVVPWEKYKQFIERLYQRERNS